MRRLHVLVIAGLLLPLGGPASQGQESGTGTEGSVAILVQAEDRTRDAGACASDGEVMQTWEPAEEPGTVILFFPEDGCWAAWDLHLAAPSMLSLRYFNAGYDYDCVVLEVHVDGVFAGATPEECGILSFITRTVPATIPAGAHELRLTFRVTGGPSWDNVFVDWVRFEVGAGGSCPSNAAPTPPGPPASDGMDAGRVGWAGFAYDFRVLAASTDPDGDPVRYRWSWGDGAMEEGGAAATHRFAGAGRFSIQVVAVDDPSARDLAGCPRLVAQGSAASVTEFRAIRDFRARLTNPPEGWACLDGVLVRAGDALGNAILLNCRLMASVDAEVTSLVARTAFALDGVPYDWDSEAPYEASYHSLMASLDHHRLEACARAAGDKHARVFCSDPYVFLNLGAAV